MEQGQGDTLAASHNQRKQENPQIGQGCIAEEPSKVTLYSGHEPTTDTHHKAS